MAFPGADEKWPRHAADFPELRDLKEYIAEAERLAGYRRATGGILVGRRQRDGMRIVYERRSNTIVFVDPAGIIASMFRPTGGERYFRKQTR